MKASAVDVCTSIVIERPLSMVAGYAADPDNAPIWYKNIGSIQWKTDRPMCIGSQFAFTAVFLGKSLSYVYEVVEYVPDGKLVMRTSDGPFPMETTYEWAATSDNATRMVLRNRGNPTGFSAIVAPFMSLMIRRENQKDLQRIKSILEGSGAP